MKITEVKCKTALSKSNLPGLDYSLNCYRGCQHSCAYCYVPNVLRIEREEWGSFVDVKTNIPVVLSKELIKKKPGVVGISTVTDPYQPVEKKYRLTRYCLEQLLRHNFPVHIQTKSNLVTRDIDLISNFSDVEVMFSIGTLNDSERKLLEPNSSSIKNRLDSMKQLSDIGIKTSVFFGPVYPTIKLGEIPEMLDVFLEHGAREIMMDKFNLKSGIFENLNLVLKNHPGFSIKNLKDKEYYDKIRNQIMNYKESKELRICDAF